MKEVKTLKDLKEEVFNMFQIADELEEEGKEELAARVRNATENIKTQIKHIENELERIISKLIGDQNDKN